MKIVFLGTGTSSGVPVIGCRCRVCTSGDPRNRRLRSSLYVIAQGRHLLIDSSIDFRQQALLWSVTRVDDVLITHTHADHVFGLDELRRYNTMQGNRIPVYGSPATIEDLARIFNYVHKPSLPGTFRPQLDFNVVTGSFDIGSIRVAPVSVVHGLSETWGFRLDADGRSLGYVPDCQSMPEASIGLLQGLDVMILDALRHRPHATHINVSESLALLSRIGAKRSYLTHMCHDLDHEETQAGLPPGVFLSYDGLTAEW